jgi:predicted dehydrogenase
VGDLRFAVMGCGFWSQYQIAGWREVGGVDLVAVYNRTRSRAEGIAQRFGVPGVYDDAEALLATEKLDFVDIITDAGTHARLVALAASHGLPVICQKPLAPDLATAREMVRRCQEAGVPLLVHENWRWQHPLREFKRALQDPAPGPVHRARITYSNSFPVFDNQPALRDLERFILTDIGTHILDTARFLFGEAASLYCRTQRVNPGIRGEDMATVMLAMHSGATVTCEMSYASPVEHDRFPETFALVECERGSVELGPDFWLRVTRKGQGTLARRCPPPFYAWADPRYAVVHASIPACCADLLRALKTGAPAETTGEDNLKTLELVFGAYASAAEGRAVDTGTDAAW